MALECVRSNVIQRKQSSFHSASKVVIYWSWWINIKMPSWDKRVATWNVDIWVVESQALPIGWVWPPLHICSTDRRRKGHKTPSVSLQWNWIETKILKLGLMIRGSKIWLVLFNQKFDWGKIGIQIKSISKHINVCYII